jgi:2-oxoisovalerate dehydrogenase E1 component
VLEGAATEEQLEAIEKEARQEVRSQQKAAWAAFQAPILKERDEVVAAIRALRGPEATAAIENDPTPIRAQLHAAARQALAATAGLRSPARAALAAWVQREAAVNRERYSSELHSTGYDSALAVAPVPARYDEGAPLVDGRQVLQRNFEVLFERRPEVLTFGEDTGGIGGVNQVMEGMQARFGEDRVTDTGIRECTIVGQGIGLAMRGFRPIAEIQYLDYIYYALQILRDDAATVRYRSAGGQKCPVIVRTRGHRLEGIWHPDGRTARFAPGHAHLRPPQHDPGRRHVQHAPRGGGAGPGH